MGCLFKSLIILRVFVFIFCAKPTKRTLLSYFSFLRYIAAKFFLTNSFFAFFFLRTFVIFLLLRYSFFLIFLQSGIHHIRFTRLFMNRKLIISTKTASISFMYIWVRVRL